ncbi:MAG: hypothetical protein ABIP97_02475 [Chthoniobacterales bacterium]
MTKKNLLKGDNHPSEAVIPKSEESSEAPSPRPSGAKVAKLPKSPGSSDAKQAKPVKKLFVGAEVDRATYEKFQTCAKQSDRSVSGMIRFLINNADFILSQGDNHLRRYE